MKTNHESLTDGPPLVRRRHGMKALPAQKPGAASASPRAGLTGNSAMALLRKHPGKRAATQGTGCGRDARAPGGCPPDGAVRGYPAGDFSESGRAPLGKLPFARVPTPRPPRLGRSIERTLHSTSMHRMLISTGRYDSGDDRERICVHEVSGPWLTRVDDAFEVVNGQHGNSFGGFSG